MAQSVLNDLRSSYIMFREPLLKPKVVQALHLNIDLIIHVRRISEKQLTASLPNLCPASIVYTFKTVKI